MNSQKVFFAKTRFLPTRKFNLYMRLSIWPVAGSFPVITLIHRD